jgi:hypothetical protein
MQDPRLFKRSTFVLAGAAFGVSACAGNIPPSTLLPYGSAQRRRSQQLDPLAKYPDPMIAISYGPDESFLYLNGEKIFKNHLSGTTLTASFLLAKRSRNFSYEKDDDIRRRFRLIKKDANELVYEASNHIFSLTYRNGSLAVARQNVNSGGIIRLVFDRFGNVIASAPQVPGKTVRLNLGPYYTNSGEPQRVQIRNAGGQCPQDGSGGCTGGGTSGTQGGGTIATPGPTATPLKTIVTVHSKPHWTTIMEPLPTPPGGGGGGIGATPPPWQNKVVPCVAAALSVAGAPKALESYSNMIDSVLNWIIFKLLPLDLIPGFSEIELLAIALAEAVASAVTLTVGAAALYGIVTSFEDCLEK